jgi:hypothetical protein
LRHGHTEIRESEMRAIADRVLWRHFLGSG